jgi:hypothetical protein
MQQVHQQNPTLPIEQVRMIAQDRLKNYLQRIQQQAVTAAAGNSPIANNMSMNMMGNLNMAGMNVNGMANMGMMNAMNMAGMNVNGLGNMGQIPAQQQYQAQLQRQLAVQQQAQRMSAGSAAGGMSLGGMSPATAQHARLSRSGTPAQGVQMMHTRSGSGAGLDLTGSPLLQ